MSPLGARSSIQLLVRTRTGVSARTGALGVSTDGGREASSTLGTACSVVGGGGAGCCVVTRGSACGWAACAWPAEGTFTTTGGGGGVGTATTTGGASGVPCGAGGAVAADPSRRAGQTSVGSELEPDVLRASCSGGEGGAAGAGALTAGAGVVGAVAAEVVS